MYLTRMELDITKRKTIMALASPAIFHGAIEQAFSEKGGKLWRIDVVNDKNYLLLVSKEQPDLNMAAVQFGTENGWEMLDYSAFLDNIHAGDRRKFRLKANPIITKSAGSGHRGTIYAHVTVNQQVQWLLKRSEKNGFHLNAGEFTVVENSWESFRKRNEERKVTFQTVVFEGLLTVTDAVLFRQILQQGIGKEKAYGCGMLTVTRPCYE